MFTPRKSMWLLPSLSKHLKRKDAVALATALDDFSNELHRAERLKLHSIDYYQRVIYRFLVFAQKPTEALSAEDLQRWLHHLQSGTRARRLSEHTRRTYTTVVRTFLAHLVVQHELFTQANPAALRERRRHDSSDKPGGRP